MFERRGRRAAEDAASGADRDPEAVAARDRAVEAVLAERKLSPDNAKALACSYEVTSRFLAPLHTKAGVEMLPAFWEAVDRNPEAVVVFLGRDGHTQAVVTEALDPRLFEQRHCREVVLSRRAVKGALRDAEHDAGKSFQLDRFIGRIDEPKGGDFAGSKFLLDLYLLMHDIPAGEPGSEIHLVDSSRKGSIQEMLQAIYPQTTFQGHYVFYEAGAGDPHPGTKRGYAMRLEGDPRFRGDGVDYLPDDPALTFAARAATSVFERPLQGPFSSPLQLDLVGPVQHLQTGPDGVISPLRLAAEYRDPQVRLGALDINLVALRDYASRIASLRQRDPGGAWQAELAEGAARGVAQVRAWLGSGDPVDPSFARVADSFAKWLDNPEVIRLASAIERSGMPEPEALKVWAAYEPRRYDQKARRSFVEAVEAVEAGFGPGGARR